MASYALTKCKACVFRHLRGSGILARKTDNMNSSNLSGPNPPDPSAPPSLTNLSTGGALTALSLSVLLASLGTSIANVGLPTLAERFGVTIPEVQWVVLSYLLAVTALTVGAGRLGDLTGPRRMFLAGILLFTAASGACGLATQLSLLIAARAVQGIGAAAMIALSLALVGTIAPKGKTGFAMGLLGTMSAVGTALGPTLGGILISVVGWRALFLVQLPLGMLAFGFAQHYLPRDPNRPQRTANGFDLAGTLLLAGSLLAYTLAMTAGRETSALFDLKLLLAALAGAGLFLLFEARAASPLIPLASFNNRGLSTSLILSLLASTVIMATLVIGPFYLSGALRLSPATVGLVLSAGPFSAALTGVPAGRLVDRFGARNMMFGALIGIAAGCGALALLPTRLGIPGYAGPLALIAASYAVFQASNNTTAISAVGPDQRGLVSGLLNLARNLGLISGASVMGALFAYVLGVDDHTKASIEAVTTGLHATFVAAFSLAVGAILIALWGHSLTTSRTESSEEAPSGKTAECPTN